MSDDTPQLNVQGINEAFAKAKGAEVGSETAKDSSKLVELAMLQLHLLQAEQPGRPLP